MTRANTSSVTSPGRPLLIVGADPAGVRLALELANGGLPVVLVTSRDIGRSIKARQAESDFYEHGPRLNALLNHELIEVLEEARTTSFSVDGLGQRVTLTHRPRPVDPERCTGCARCLEVCPVEIAEPGAAKRKPVLLASSDSGPCLVSIEREGRPYCQTGCPIGVNIQGYMALMARGKFVEALNLIRRRNPLPGICGRVCHHPCEEICRRQEVDQPLSICKLKRFAADFELKNSRASTFIQPDMDRNEQVAIIGSGPAGLSAAVDLRRFGYQVTIFEALPAAGGLLRVGIPAYRLPRAILNYEIDRIKKAGVTIRTGIRIGKDMTIKDLFRQGYQAVLAATGAHLDRRTGLPGENLKGIRGCLAFLRSVNLGRKVRVGRRVIVIGGGNAAIDAARSSIRLGALSVTILYRRSEEEMPADPEEVEAARQEGVKIAFLASPVSFEGVNGTLRAVRCQKMTLGLPDESGRRRPEGVPDSEYVIEADDVILAIGQSTANACLDGLGGVAFSGDRMKVDDQQFTGVPGLFAAGDVVRGPDTVIRAMAEGQKAALAIHSYIGREKTSWPDWSSTDLNPDKPLCRGIRPEIRREPARLAMTERKSTFREVDRPFSPEEAIKESGRCLQCGICSECGQCVEACGEVSAIDHSEIRRDMEIEVLDIIRTDRREPLPDGFKKVLTIDDHLRRHEEPDQIPALAWELLYRFRDYRQEIRHRPEPVLPAMDQAGIGIFLCRCNSSLHHADVLEDLALKAGELPGAAEVHILNAACTCSGAEAMAEGLLRGDYDRILLASCLCCPLEIICGSCTHQKVRAKRFLYADLGIPLSRLEVVNLKDEALGRHSLKPKAAFNAACRLLRMGAGRSLSADVQLPLPADVSDAVALVGVEQEAVLCALSLREMNHPVIMILPPVGRRRKKHPLEAGDVEALRRAGVGLFEPLKIISLDGTAGGYSLSFISAGREEQTLRAGAVVLGVGGPKPKKPDFVPARLWLDSDRHLPPTGIFIWNNHTGLHNGKPDPCQLAAVASRFLRSTGRIPAYVPATVDSAKCRGCARCRESCPQSAIELVPVDGHLSLATVSPISCTSCGRCLAVCPTGAINMPFQGHRQLRVSLAAALQEDF